MKDVAPEVSTPIRDITFACVHCASPLVVDVAAAGLTLPCQKCGKPTVVPDIPERAARISRETEAQLAELKRHLKENEAQLTEITGYINQLNIQLHRWQLRLQTLNERKKELEAELRKIS
jgi:septal ring factor EnvC (AmiA/AmiB activator)